MTLIEYALYLFLLNITVLILLFCFIAMERTIHFILEKYHKKNETHIINIISDLITKKNHENIKIPFIYNNSLLILKVVSKFDQKISSPIWEEFKKNFTKKYLLNKARKYANSFFWKKRFLAAKTFSVYCEKKDFFLLHKLLDDKSFIVQREAGSALIKKQDIQSIHRILKKLYQCSSYEQMFLKDLLAERFIDIFPFLEKILAKTSKKEVILSCLDLLSTKTSILNNPLIYDVCDSKDEELKVAGIRLHALNPQTDSQKVLIKEINNKNPTIRMLCNIGLRNFYSEENFKRLSESLNDENWEVRLAAANSLKFVGDQGVEFLKKCQNSSKNNIKQVASYVLYSNYE